MKKRKKILAIFLVGVLFFQSSVALALEHITFDRFYVGDTVTTHTPPMEQNTDLNLSAKSGILMEATTGRILYQKNENEVLPPASITKIMTLLLVMEDIAENKVKLEDKVDISPHAMGMGGSQVWLEPGEDMSVDDLLKATAIASANDAAMALAEHLEGSETAFVARMNQRAKELGMENTTFHNPTGLDAEGHVTTAKDIALMSKALLKHDYILTYTTTWMDSLRNGATQLVNTNKMVRFYEGSTGLKTGTTDGAGSCLSATAERKGLKLIAVVMGSPTSNDRFDSAKKLLDYGYAKYEMAPLPPLSQEFQSILVSGGESQEAPLHFEMDGEILIPKGKKDGIKVEIKLPEEVKAPVEKNQLLGKVVVSIEDKVLHEYQIQAKEEVKSLTFVTGFFFLLKSLFYNG